jgi:hypothetical protein
MESKGREGLGTTLLVSHSTRYTDYQRRCRVIGGTGVEFRRVMLFLEPRKRARGASSDHYIAR